jgi:hypothetical protein
MFVPSAHRGSKQLKLRPYRLQVAHEAQQEGAEARLRTAAVLCVHRLRCSVATFQMKYPVHTTQFILLANTRITYSRVAHISLFHALCKVLNPVQLLIRNLRSLINHGYILNQFRSKLETRISVSFKTWNKDYYKIIRNKLISSNELVSSYVATCNILRK